MAEEENNNTEETPEAEAPAETPEAAEEAPAPEAEEAPADVAAPEAEEAAPETEEAAPAEDEAPPAEAPAAEEAAEPEEVLGPKAARKRARSTHSGEVRPQRSPEERASERAALRSTNAASRRRRRGSERSKRGEPGQGTPPAERVPGTKTVQFGTVVSDKADKTITVRVDIVRRHRRYEKVVRQSATVHAHDERNEAAEGDLVRVMESRPLSRTKRWRLVEVVEKAR